MIFYQLPFIKLLNVKVGTIILFIIIYLFFNDSLYHLSDQQQVSGIPYPEHPKKIDIGRGEDIWFLTDEDEVV
jgi:hypothetical protein